MQNKSELKNIGMKSLVTRLTDYAYLHGKKKVKKKDVDIIYKEIMARLRRFNIRKYGAQTKCLT